MLEKGEKTNYCRFPPLPDQFSPFLWCPPP